LSWSFSPALFVAACGKNKSHGSCLPVAFGGGFFKEKTTGLECSRGVNFSSRSLTDDRHIPDMNHDSAGIGGAVKHVGEDVLGACHV
jgi:hypothetical protein